MFRNLRSTAVLAPLVAALLAPLPAHADNPPDPGGPLTTTITVTETDYTPGGQETDSFTYQPVVDSTGTAFVGSSDDTAVAAAAKRGKAPGSVTPAGTSSGGTSSASGCKKLSVMKEGKTLLGATAYQFINETYWCWTRSTQNVYNVSTDWWLGKFDPEFYWRGIINTILGFYDYGTNDGHPHSAYKNYRQGQVDDCPIKFCTGTIYPSVLIRSYYNGTYVWDIEG